MNQAQRQSPTLEQANRLFQQGHTEQGTHMAEAVLLAEPRNVDAMILLAQMSRARGDRIAIDRMLQAAQLIKPRDRFLMTATAQNLMEMGRSAEALAACDRALAIFNDDAEFLRLKASAHESRLEFEKANNVLQRLLKLEKPSGDALALAGRVLHGLKQFDQAIALTRPVAEDVDQPPAQRARIWFQLVKTFDRMGDYDRAMDASKKAHALSTARFDAGAFAALVDDLLAAFSPASLRALSRSSMKSDLPVFVIGMPRSGTTLVEQIIHAHPAGFGAGELTDIENIAKSIAVHTGSMHAYPHAVVDITAEIADRYAAEYLSRLKAFDASATRIVNKMLEQYQHVGLIWLLLPGARIIHTVRDPLDTCLSCFTRPLNAERMPYARSLEHLGFVYRQHERLMAHWKAVLDLPILTVRYEELVADQQRISRQIIDFLGLPWDDRCLKYWEADRTVMTLSYDQVNKPIYDSSIGRWKHYAKHLGPLKAALGIND